MKVAIIQFNPTVGDFNGNASKVVADYQDAVDRGAELVVTSELALWGYPPGDLLLDTWRLRAHDNALVWVIKKITRVPLIIGITEGNKSGSGKPLFNSAAFIRDGKIVATQAKSLLPTYDIFDESRYFAPNSKRDVVVVEHNGRRITMLVCEDIWGRAEEIRAVQKLYDYDPLDAVSAASADLLVTLNASPYHWGKGDVRRTLVQSVAARCNCPVVYAAQVGANTELVFDGRSMIATVDGTVAQMSAYKEDVSVYDVDLIVAAADSSSNDANDLCALYDALVLGVRDYYVKSGFFSGAVLGLSGGIDSALTLAIAVDALGTQRVKVVSLPSRYTAGMSNDDARKQAKAMGVAYSVISIEPAVGAFASMLAGEFAGKKTDVTEENIQARSRGVVLMALSNKENRLLLTTGNKSEMAVGYATLYGDMAGGLAVIADVPKTLVYALARYRNTISPVIPERVITRSPSAELALGQVDSSTLPPYDLLDPILEAYVEKRVSPTEIIAQGYDAAVVKRVCRMVDRNEYKRRQAAPVLRVTSKAFGSGRRYPIVATY